MTQSPTAATSWPQSHNRVVARLLTHHRRARGLTADQLADRVSDLGLPFSRHQILNLESARRSTSGVSVAVLMALAAALEIAPLQLLFPIGEHDDQIEVLPGIQVDTWSAARWFAGTAPLTEASEQWQSGVGPIARRRAHDQLLDQWQRSNRTAQVENHAARFETDPQQRADHLDNARVSEYLAQTALRDLGLVRYRMARAGEVLPDIPGTVHDRIEGPLPDEVD